MGAPLVVCTSMVVSSSVAVVRLVPPSPTMISSDSSGSPGSWGCARNAIETEKKKGGNWGMLGFWGFVRKRERDFGLEGERGFGRNKMCFPPCEGGVCSLSLSLSLSLSIFSSVSLSLSLTL